MARPKSLIEVDISEVPDKSDVEKVYFGKVRGTGKVSSVGIEHYGQEVFIIVKKVLK